MKGIIIAGGFGTRLRPLTYRRPKPLVPVANRPFLEYQVALLKAHGIDDLVLATNYLAEQIEAHFGDGSRFGVRMRYALEETPLGTGGAIRNAANLFPGEAVAVFNGDVLTDFPLSAILAFHQQKQAMATITLAPVPSPNAFGVLILDESGRVLEWREPSEEMKKALAGKQNLTPTGTDLINAGFYVLSPEFIARIPDGKPCSVERDIYPTLLAERAPIYGIAPGGYWMDMGRGEQLLTATKAVLTGAVTTALPGASVGASCQIAATAKLDAHSSIGTDCVLGEEAQLSDTILHNNVRVGARAKLCGVIVDDNVEIGEDVSLIALPGSPTPPIIASCSVLARGTDLRL